MEAIPAPIPSLVSPGSKSLSPTGTSLRRIRRARILFLLLPWFGLLWQSILSQSIQDIVPAFIAASSSFLLFFDSFRIDRLYRYPFSTLVMLGFGVTGALGPLLFTALEGNKITFNLKLPLDTFGHFLIVGLALMVSHKIYRSSQSLLKLRDFVHRRLLQLKLFNPLKTREAIIMSFFGCFSLATLAWLPEIAQQSQELGKFIRGFEFFSVIPSVFMLQALSRRDSTSNSLPLATPIILLSLSLFVIILISMGSTARGFMVFPLVSLALGLFFQFIYGRVQFSFKSLIVFVFVISFLVPQASDLAMAMQMVRVHRGKLPPYEMVNLTFDQLQDREAIAREKRRSFLDDVNFEWNSTYVSNIFLDRFANAKIPDNSLQNSSQLSPSQGEKMASYLWTRLLMIFPAPLLSLFGIPEKTKLDVLGMSIGDKLYALTLGLERVGGFRTSHFVGSGMAAFGYGYLLILIFSMLLIFPLVDAHASPPIAMYESSFLSPPLFSIVAATQIYFWMTFSNSESVIDYLTFVTRGFIQPVLLFALFRFLFSRLRLA